ncbi:PilN domain-containing protein [Allocoleopsis franciscana]|uniref:Tfp pilus assembly protein PilN n=1 Tax=Allocoleopsis franciscana PCC 7113 TaxID=1173027 RepID=K9WKK2_9CYAN|nr:PilN domain-containing protein [Allocoleopsis franciscana]AFZ20341.1 Tfp pilus assembly protein PilN [Allocoleopsis franciscana PCC 7113]
MYSLDVNFLKDRPDLVGQRGGERASAPPTPAGSMTPLIIGVAVGLLLPGLVGGLWLFLQQQNAQVQEEINQLNVTLGGLKQAEQQIKQLTDETNRVKSETAALASVFNQIKPWSAMLEDIQERVPPNVQILSIEQKQVAAPAAPAATAAPAAGAKNPKPGTQPASPSNNMTTKLQITGSARSFDDVNYFLLTLQRSPFFKSDETQLIVAKLQESPSKLEFNESQIKVKYELPKAVGYTIQTSLNDVPASELIRELDRKGAVGLVTRIRTLQDKGVFQK